MANEGSDWSREENEAIVADYFSMFMDEISDRPYSKAEHNRALQAQLTKRSRGSIEWKHRNISAVLLQLGCPYISGYQPAFRYQNPLREVVVSRLEASARLRDLLAVDAERPVAAAAVGDILDIVDSPPQRDLDRNPAVEESDETPTRYSTQSPLEREARNRKLGQEGELFTLEFERVRLLRAGRKDLARKIEHVASTRGDGDGFDILSFDATGIERLIEVKTTKYGPYTPFFVTRNELRVSRKTADRYHLYRLYHFAKGPRLYQLRGDLADHCDLTPTTYRADVS